MINVYLSFISIIEVDSIICLFDYYLYVWLRWNESSYYLSIISMIKVKWIISLFKYFLYDLGEINHLFKCYLYDWGGMIHLYIKALSLWLRWNNHLYLNVISMIEAEWIISIL